CKMSLEPNSCVRRTELTFTTYGARSLLIAKFVPGLSTVAPPLAGVVGIPLRDFMAFSTVGAILWVSAYLAIGWLLSSQLEVVAAYAEELGGGLLVVLVALVGGYILWKYVARRRFVRRLHVMRISPEELKTRLDAGEDVLVVDVR